MKQKSTYLLNLLIITFLLNTSLNAQKAYQIDAREVGTKIRSGHLDLGGESVTGENIGVNNFYIERNGEPFMPVVGELHYSRYPNQYWDESIKKMKAGGITVIATYIFWNLHEKKEGVFSWEGDLNLRRFIELCKANHVDAIIRVGPFDHGEIRNGGIPDWLYGRPFEIRSNDQPYLDLVEILYQQIAQQVEGLFFKDGGPIIGVQVENEYQHSASPWAITYEGAEKEYTTARMDRKITQVGVGINEIGNDNLSYGQKHMQTLKKMIKEAGMVAPIYTATGWGYASIVENGSIPVMSAYAYPFWVEESKASNFYLFKDMHKNPDYSPVTYIPEDYPSIAAEIGTGMSVTYSRRPRVPGESFQPMMVRMLGSGSNGLGYYMYHGGTTPSDGFFMYSEGSGLNLKSYDYQAPIGEFGQTSTGFYGLKIINSFINNYGHVLAPMYPILPETNAAIVPENNTTLRYTVRSDGNKGFLFMQNFQDHLITNDLKELKIDINTKNGIIQFPENGSFTLKSGTSAIFPFNMKFNDVAVKYATVQPLCKLENKGVNHHVFFSIDGITPEIVLRGNQKVSATGAKVTNRDGNTVITGANSTTFGFKINSVHFLVIPVEKAAHAYVVGKSGHEYLMISDALVLEDQKTLQMISRNSEVWDLNIYPKLDVIHSLEAKIVSKTSSKDLLDSYTIEANKVIPKISLTQYDDRHYVLDAKELNFSGLNDVYIKFDYKGDRVMCMLNGELATDNFYTSQPWQIGLKRYKNLLKDKLMYFYFFPMKKNAPYLSYLDAEVIPDFSLANEFLEIKTPEIIPEYKIVFTINKQ